MHGHLNVKKDPVHYCFSASSWFIVRIYHDTRSPERQERLSTFVLFTRVHYPTCELYVCERNIMLVILCLVILFSKPVRQAN